MFQETKAQVDSEELLDCIYSRLNKGKEEGGKAIVSFSLKMALEASWAGKLSYGIGPSDGPLQAHGLWL